jgi:hypothetical protein
MARTPCHPCMGAASSETDAGSDGLCVGHYSATRLLGVGYFPQDLLTPEETARASNDPLLLSANIMRKENYAIRLVALALRIAPSKR